MSTLATQDHVTGWATGLFHRAARRFRARLLAIADEHRRSPWDFDPAEVLEALYAQERQLSRAARLSNLAAWMIAAKQTALPAFAGLPPGRGGPPIDAATAFGDSPDPPRLPVILKAADWLQTRLDYTPDEFKALDDDAKQLGFTVARTTSLEAVNRIKNSLVENIARGQTLREFKTDAQDALAGTLLSDPQIETIYRTQLAKSYSAGQAAVLRHPLVAPAFPYCLYSATHDSRVRPDHLQLERMGLDGTAVFRADDPFWDLFTPPWAWNSVVPETELQGRVQCASKARYTGDVLKLTTKGGRRLTVTPDHPVLTRRGFVAAKLLAQGEHLLGYRGPVDGAAVPQDDVDHPPARAADLFDALRGLTRTVPVEAVPLYFNGDPMRGYGQIEVVPADRCLWNDPEMTALEFLLQVGLPCAYLTQPTLAGRCASEEMIGGELLAASGFRAFDQIPPAVSNDTVFRRVGPAANLSPRRLKASPNGGTADAELFGELQLRHPGEVVGDELVRIESQHFDGFVYDAQTTTGYMVADGIVVSNCRCVKIPLSIADAARRGVREAKEWRRSGQAPIFPEYVKLPDFRPPDGWVPVGLGIPMAA